MKGIASYILIALGIILILAAILWWAIAVNALVKLPDDIDVVNMYEGEVTYYVDIETGAPLAPGSELKLPLEIEQDFTSDSGLYDSTTAVIKEIIKTDVMMVPQEDIENSYILDRKSMENKDKADLRDQAYAFKTSTFAGEEMTREGNYYPQFPIDTSKDEAYPIWKNEVNEGIETEFLGEEDKEGVTVYNYRLAFEEKEVTEGYIEQMKLPAQTSFEGLKPTLAAMGVDVDGLIALATQAMSPEDLQALNTALQQAIPLTYFWSMDQELSVEPKTGTPVDLYKCTETLSMKLDTTSLEDAFTILAEYAGDPNLGPALAQLADLQAQIGEAQKIFEQAYTTTEDTRKTAIEDAKDNAGSINLVKVYIPWALLIVGAFVLIVGLLLGGGQETPQEAEE